MSDIKQSRKALGERATHQQRQAADPKYSVWVEASAGTGKTKVLSDRVLRLLLTGVRPERILCLTYTKAAAVEMSSRIAKKLSGWSIISDDELISQLNILLGDFPNDKELAGSLLSMARKQFALLLETPGGMKIQTIHSFCQEILKRFPIEAGISPYFSVMDDRSSKEAINEVRSGLIDLIEDNPESCQAHALAYLTQNVSEYSFPNIMTSITANRAKLSALFKDAGSLDCIINSLAQKLRINEGETREDLISDFFRQSDREAAKDVAEAWEHGTDKARESAENLRNLLLQDNNEKKLSSYRSFFLSDSKIKKCGTKDAIAHNPNLENIFNDEAEKILKFEEQLKSLNVFNSTKAVLFLAQELILSYNKYKAKHSKLDYEDLIVLTQSLLANREAADWVLYKLDGGIDHVLIDEAQDTSPSQWQIIKSLTQEFFSGFGVRDVERTVFAVGDRKQSIYSFQGADPREFDASRIHFSQKAKSFKNIKLEVSFRSTSAVLNLVNNVFGDEKIQKGVVSEGENITHIPYRKGDGGRIEFWPLILSDKAEEDLSSFLVRRDSESASVKLARMIAENIKNLVESKELLPAKNRPIKYSDFLILVQRRNHFIDEFVRECKSIGVNVAGIDKINLLEQIAIQDLIAFGKFLLLPEDDLNLAALLKSPILGLDDDDLFELCYNRGSKALWSRLAQNPKYAPTHSLLKDVMGKTDFLRPFELYSYILVKLGGRKKFVERMGFEVVDGLDEFINLTINYESEHIPSLQGFINWISKDDVEIKREQEQSNIDAVKIMTVHGSKGLQSPIVVLPDTIRVSTEKKEAKMLWDELFLYPLAAKDYNQFCCDISDKSNELSLEEYRRLMYVALTRAEDRLYVCGYSNKEKTDENSWFGILESKVAELAEVQQDEKQIYETPQELKLESRERKEEKAAKINMPSWINEVAPIENPLSKPYTPSKDEENEEVVAISPLSDNGENRYRRGVIIHKLLQYIPSVAQENRQDTITSFLATTNLKDYDKKKIASDIFKLFSDEKFAVLFGANSREEVPIMGEVDGKIISAQIDRLVVEEDRIMVVDFKTNRPAATYEEDIPKQYVKQLKMYKTLLEKIYQCKKVEAYILWTDTANLMEVNI